MPASELLQLAKAGRYHEFETRCLELIESGQLVLAQLLDQESIIVLSFPAENVGHRSHTGQELAVFRCLAVSPHWSPPYVGCILKRYYTPTFSPCQEGGRKGDCYVIL